MSSSTRWTLALCLALAPALSAQVVVDSDPGIPVQGTLFRLRVARPPTGP